jgi:hypothetical protein
MKIDRDGIWSRDGVPVEELPDPFAPEPALRTQEELPEAPRRRRRWPMVLYAVSVLLLCSC